MQHHANARASRCGPLRASILACALVASLPLLANAQDLPQQLPAPPVPDTLPRASTCDRGCPEDPNQATTPPPGMGAAFVLQRVEFKGTTVFTPEQLATLAADEVGREVGFADLQRIAARVTGYYRRNGYTLAQAVLPVQEITDGVVEISVLEGRIGKISVEVDPATPVSEERVRTMLGSLQEGQPLQGLRYERSMLLLSDMPGVRPQSILETGRQAGSNDLVVQVAPADRIRFNLELDNHGTREVGRWRLGGTLRWASPLGIGDNLDVRVLASDEKLLRGDGTVFGRVSYEAPVGVHGTRVGAGASRVSYSLGGDFEILDAVGIARIYDVGVMHPVIRQRAHNLFLRGFVDRKELTDELRAVPFETDKRVEGVGMSWAWERRDGFGGGGYWSSSGALYHGQLSLLDAGSRGLDDGPFGRDASGSFNKLTIQVARLQRLGERLSLFAALGGQAADRNLDSSEKLSLGGPRAVRAYPSSEVLVDEGSIGNFELRWTLNDQLTVLAFYDIATGKFNHRPGAFDLDNERTLRGPGLGLSYAADNGFTASMSLAWRDTRAALSDGGDRNPRLFVHMMKSF